MFGIRQAFGRDAGMEIGWITSFFSFPRRKPLRTEARRRAVDPFAAHDALAVRPFHEALR